MLKSSGGSRKSPRAAAAGAAVEVEAEVPAPGLTGSYLILLPESDDEMRAGAQALASVTGLQVAHSRDFQKKPLLSAFEEADTLVFETLGVAVVDAPPDQVQARSGAGASAHPRGRARADRLRAGGAAGAADGAARNAGADRAGSRLGRAVGRLPARLPRGGAAPDRHGSPRRAGGRRPSWRRSPP